MNQTRKESSAISHDSTSAKDKEAFVLEFHGVRYQVKDVSRSVAFYTKQLGLKLDMQQIPAFASVSIVHARCPMVVAKSRVAGIGWSYA